MRRRRGIALASVLCLLALPAAAVLFGAARHYFENRTSGTIVSSGMARPYILHVPDRYDPAKPTPLVISMHGAMNWPAFQKTVSGWNRLADEHGFVVVYPAGEGTGPAIWLMRGRRTPASMPDVVFISELIDELRASYNIDPARIYANGLSNGAGMAFALSCTLSHRIAAVGLVASAHILPFDWCADTRPVPMVAFHGTADPVTPYAGGKVWIAADAFPSIPQWTARWARRNRCAASATESAAAASVTKLEYTGCADDASVVLYTIRNGGHSWPGGLRLPEWLLGKTSDDIDATRVMWKFYQEHPLR
jgi:polyhydroxybutyrate depolymerase